MSDGIPNSTSVSQYEACMAASLSVSGETQSSGDEVGVAEIE